MGLLETAEAFFAKEQWVADRAKDAPVLRLAFQGKNGRWRCFLEAKEQLSQLVFFSVKDPPVPEERRAAVAELFMRINCRLNVGNFEVNFNDGIARCRSGIDVEGVGDVTPLVRNLAMLNVATMDKYFAALEGVIAGEAPMKALAAVPDE